MSDTPDQNLPMEYLILKAANDKLREEGKERLWASLELICSQLSGSLKPGAVPILVGLQEEWKFVVENSTMVGERFGARHGTNTLIVEVGWPRLPEHGFVPDGGLARGRIRLSRNVMLEPQTLTEMIYKRQPGSEPAWHTISNKRLGERITEPLLRSYVEQLLHD